MGVRAGPEPLASRSACTCKSQHNSGSRRAFSVPQMPGTYAHCSHDAGKSLPQKRARARKSTHKLRARQVLAQARLSRWGPMRRACICRRTTSSGYVQVCATSPEQAPNASIVPTGRRPLPLLAGNRLHASHRVYSEGLNSMCSLGRPSHGLLCMPALCPRSTSGPQARCCYGQAIAGYFGAQGVYTAPTCGTPPSGSGTRRTSGPRRAGCPASWARCRGRGRGRPPRARSPPARPRCPAARSPWLSARPPLLVMPRPPARGPPRHTPAACAPSPAGR